jgi:hypothetical protein
MGYPRGLKVGWSIEGMRMKRGLPGIGQLDWHLKLGTLGILAVLIVSAYLYLKVFNGSLSQDSSVWSAFGSFFGGLFGPLISLVTLLAVLRTVELQKQLLEIQQREFEDLSSIQRAANADSRLAEYKSHQLQLLDQQINMFERMQDRYNQQAEYLASRNRGIVYNNDIADLDKAMASTEVSISRLVRLSIEVSLEEYEDIEELKLKVSSGLEKIDPFFAGTTQLAAIRARSRK